MENGRGSPHGGVWLSFEHIDEDVMKENFGPMIGRLAKNGIDLQKSPIEVSPIAHYHMGGIRVDREMRTRVPGLYAAGEAVGGANGATRLSGNAIPEAFVFGERAGRFGAAYAKGKGRVALNQKSAMDDISGIAPQLRNVMKTDISAAGLMTELQELMWDKVGLFRTAEKLGQALTRIREMQKLDLYKITIPDDKPFNQALLDWYELRAGLLCAESVTVSAINRTESRGAHQREDIPDASPDFERNQIIELRGTEIIAGWAEVPRISYTLEEKQAPEI